MIACSPSPPPSLRCSMLLPALLCKTHGRRDSRWRCMAWSIESPTVSSWCVWGWNGVMTIQTCVWPCYIILTFVQGRFPVA
jgi:hypothetical protein